MKIVFLTGAGMSVESGLSTFRGGNGMWDNYPVEAVASHEGWLRDPLLVNKFYNIRRRELFNVQPNDGHRLIADLEKDHQVTVVTQNVDNLHERAGSHKVIHLHGELTKVCSSDNPDDPRCIRELTADNCEVMPGERANDGSLLRPFIVFFGEAVPMIEPAIDEVETADVFVIIGTSLNVYPAASLSRYVKPGTPVYLIDPDDMAGRIPQGVTHIQKGATEGIKELIGRLGQAK